MGYYFTQEHFIIFSIKKSFFHISPCEIQSLLQVQSQLALPLWSFLYGTHACLFELLKYFILLLWHLFSAFYCVTTHRESCLFPGMDWIIFIHCPWKCLASCLAQNRGFTDIRIFNVMFTTPLCLWEGHLCIMESPVTKTTTLGSIWNTVVKSCIHSFNKYVLIHCGCHYTPELESKELEKVILTIFFHSYSECR